MPHAGERLRMGCVTKKRPRLCGSVGDDRVATGFTRIDHTEQCTIEAKASSNACTCRPLPVQHGAAITPRTDLAPVPASSTSTCLPDQSNRVSVLGSAAR